MQCASVIAHWQAPHCRLLVCRELRPVYVDEGILVIEGRVVCGQPRTIHHFGLDFTQNGRLHIGPFAINRLPRLALEFLFPKLFTNSLT